MLPQHGETMNTNKTVVFAAGETLNHGKWAILFEICSNKTAPGHDNSTITKHHITFYKKKSVITRIPSFPSLQSNPNVPSKLPPKKEIFFNIFCTF